MSTFFDHLIGSYLDIFLASCDKLSRYIFGLLTENFLGTFSDVSQSINSIHCLASHCDSHWYLVWRLMINVLDFFREFHRQLSQRFPTFRGELCRYLFGHSSVNSLDISSGLHGKFSIHSFESLTVNYPSILSGLSLSVIWKICPVSHGILSAVRKICRDSTKYYFLRMDQGVTGKPE
jgi:hypothetical protein